jgi:DNA repair exonuclease SbcCD nuclease subunit
MSERTLFVGDIHAKSDLAMQRACHLARITAADRMVFLGDYMDDWNISNKRQIEAYDALVRWTRQLPCESVYLLGNHDIPYVVGRTQCRELRDAGLCPGFRPGAYRHIHESVMAELCPKVAWSDGKVLATHAGVTRQWLDAHGHGEDTPDEIASLLNLFILGAFRLPSLMCDVGPARGGAENAVPSPLWTDAGELMAFGDRRYPQVVGHTPMPTVRSSGSLFFCDTMSATPDGEPIGDGSMLLMEADGDERTFRAVNSPMEWRP